MKNAILIILSLFFFQNAFAEDLIWSFESSSFIKLEDQNCRDQVFSSRPFKVFNFDSKYLRLSLEGKSYALVRGTLLVDLGEGKYGIYSQFINEIEGLPTLPVEREVVLSASFVKELRGDLELKIHNIDSVSNKNYTIKEYNADHLIGKTCGKLDFITLESKDKSQNINLPTKVWQGPMTNIEVLLSSETVLASSPLRNLEVTRPATAGQPTAEPQPRPDRREEEAALSPLGQEYADIISSGRARLTSENIVSLYNEDLSEATIADMEKERLAREALVKSDSLYMCVNNDLTGFSGPSRDSESVKLDKIASPIQVLNTDSVEVEEGGAVYTLQKIRYESKEYWVTASLKRNSGEVVKFLSRFSECPRIQNDVLAEYLEGLSSESSVFIAGVEVFQEESRVKYVCTDDANGTLNLYTNEDLETKISAGNGSEVSLVQKSGLEPFEADNGHTYIRVNYDGHEYWAAEEFIKSYGECPSMKQMESVYACVENSLNYYSDEESLSAQSPSGSFDSYQILYRDYSYLYQSKILKDGDKEVVYVPVRMAKDSSKVHWVAESYVPKECDIDPSRAVTYTSSQGLTCTVHSDDNFPYYEHSAKFDYRTDSAEFRAGRNRGRLHAGVDLYSYRRYDSENGRSDYGLSVYSIDDGEVVGRGTWGHTAWVLVKSTKGYSWNYGEVGRLEVDRGEHIKRGDKIGKAKQYVRNNSKYPAMLHLEKYTSTRIRDPKQNWVMPYKRHRSVTNPTCHVEYMSRRKFGKVWDGE